MDQAPQSIALDQTQDSAPSLVARPTGGKKRAVALIQGSQPALSSETNELLRRRLRSASLLLFGGFLAFFVRSLLHLDKINTQFDVLLLADHGVMTVVTGAVALRLCMNCPFVLRHLRAVELTVFGGSGAFFFVVSYWIVSNSAGNGYLTPVTSLWMLLIFTYSLFIPNTLQRAAAVVGSMAAAPVLLVTVMSLIDYNFTQVMQERPELRGYVSETIMVMALASTTAVWGSHTMGTLRREAFEAKQLGQYRLKKKIGEGGMGEVHLAEHLLLKRPCAVKLIRPQKAGNPQALARFEREVRATARLTHWNTIEIYDYGRADDGTFYYAMEYLPGMNLGQLVELNGPLPEGRVIHLLSQTCEALSEAHRQGLIHRDLKPANIFAAHRGDVFDVAKLLDFGLAKPITQLTSTELTIEGTITGSPLYMSPEQVTGDETPDARSDIYSLGVVAYYLLAGAPPFQDSAPIKVMLAHAGKEPPPLSRGGASISRDLESVVLRCLEKDPDHRYQSAEDLRRALLHCVEAGSWTREDAADWWQCNGCPQKKALDEAVLDAVTV